VLLVEGCGEERKSTLAEGRRVYAKLAEHLSPSQAAKLAAELTGAPRKALYGSGE
jgi:16S rRNA (cytidine1402-2'-O)-methyltransferase